LRLSKAKLVVVTAAGLVLALLMVFAIELSGSQTSSKNAVEAQVHERAVLAGALIDSLLRFVWQSVPQDATAYGSRTVQDRTMDAAQGQMGGYLVLVNRNGAVLASSTGFSAQARAGLAKSTALRLVLSGKPYALGNFSSYGKTSTIDFDVALRTHYGTRVLIDGFEPTVVSGVVTAELARIPGVRGARNYLVDGNDVVLATTTQSSQVGHMINEPGAVTALLHPSADVDGSYFDEFGLTNSQWRIVLVAPNGPLFASVTGLREWLPWVIFLAFALVAGLALVLGLRDLRSSDQLKAANADLGLLNIELTGANTLLERRARELARSNEELDQFASIASHDLQEPLRKVRTFADQLAATEGERLSDKGRDYLDRVSSAAERMQKLIEDLLRFSRVATQGHEFAPVNLGEITRGVLGDLDAQIESSQAVVHVGALPTINGDALQVRQLMQNLISNALKFHREGQPTEVTIDAVLTEDTVRLNVRDNGIGFDPRYSQRIFRIFERLHGRNDYPGTGIGLALCRKIAERHGGTIVADSRPGDGATFTVTLPAYQRGPVTVQADEADSAGVLETEKAHVNA
jgi:signal transduction histidine kinase